MKSLIQSFFAGCVLSIISFNAAAKHTPAAIQADTTITLKVLGVCEMCKKRIEAAAVGKGVKAALWDVSSKILTLTYNPARTTPGKVSSRIVAAGHDTPEQKAENSVYNSLPECCRYREFSSMDEMTGNTPEPAVQSPAPETNSNIPVSDSAAAFIATAHIKGVVLEQDPQGNLKPLSGANIVWLGSLAGTSTDAKGNFDIARVANSRRIIVSYVGFEPDTVAVPESNALQVILSKSKQLQEVRITAGGRASAYINSYDPLRTLNITQKELKKAACCNLSESFETNPSVDVSAGDAVTGSKQIQLLGLSGNYTQLTVENLPGPRGLATPLGLNSIPGTWIEAIQLVKGTGSVANGFESIAGQINVELKKPATSERLYANVYVNDFGKTDLNLNLSQKLGKRWSTTLLLHDAFLNNNKIDFNKDGFRDLPTGNLFSAVNRWSYTDGRGFSAHFGVKLLHDEKTGGQVSFDPAKDKLTTNSYGLQMNTRRWEAFGKAGYVFPGQPHKSIGFQVSGYQHHQNAYFGLRTYNADQRNLYSNLIYQSRIGSDKHKFRTGLSLVNDQYQEVLQTQRYNRKEVVPGGFFEYTYSPSQKLDVVAGIREDRNSLYGWFTTPRLHVRYEPFKGTILRASVGRGQRTANIFAENNSVLVSARNIQVLSTASGKAYGLDPEVAWNKGISADQRFKLFGRTANLSAEFFRNDFRNQVIVDLENPSVVSFYNLEGRSYANSFQGELSFEPLQKLNVRLAYRHFNVKSTYDGKLLLKPFTAKNRGFANLAYEVKDWKFDYTVSFNGIKRLPSTEGLPEVYKQKDYAPAYTIMNAQISRTLGKKRNIDLYIGGENLTDFFQKNAIIAANQPFSSLFDASLIWGPISGRMLYGGFRFSLK